MYRHSNRSTRSSRTSHSYNPFSFSVSSVRDWFYRRYGEERSRERPSVRDRYYLRSSDNRMEEEGSSVCACDVEMASEEDLVSVIHVTGVDLMINANCPAHYTDCYDITEDRSDDFGNAQKAQLVLRRGQSFDLTLTFNRAYDVKTDDVSLVFAIGDKPVAHKNTRVRIEMNENKADFKREPFRWGAVLKSQEGNNITVTVHPAANCIIGEWEVTIQTILQENEGASVKVFEYQLPDDIIILLNPWCKDDAVYMSTSKLLDEYVLNEYGFQFYGNHRQIGKMRWLFGQFEEGILEVALSLLRLAYKGKISDKMADPAKIARALSQAVNSSDEGGVLTGNWSGDYTGGQKPNFWSGSVAILQQYRATGKPVKFGQCWVFSGVLTTVCRALGLPARSLTNFRSAHDTDTSVAIDKHFKLDRDGDRDYLDFSDDSIWNFHVWNEVWMSRRDLPPGFDGWQAVDATPQEASDGVFCCGPCPLSAIKNGYIQTPYDGAFLFAEVNAHVVHWQQTGPSGDDWEVAEVDKLDVGRRISTKDPFSNDRLDITHEYKYTDGSQKEYNVMKKVAEYLGKDAREYLAPKKNFTVSLKDIDEVVIGQPFNVSGTFANTSKQNLTFSGSISVLVTTYTGKIKRKIKSYRFRDIELKSNEDKTISMAVEFDEYYDKLVEGAAMKVRIMVQDDQNNQSTMAEDDFSLTKPFLLVKTQGAMKIKEPINVTVSFTNPLSVPLNNCVVLVESRNIIGGVKEVKPQQRTVGVGEEFVETVAVVAKRRGRKEIFATFDSDELEAVAGSVEVVIE